MHSSHPEQSKHLLLCLRPLSYKFSTFNVCPKVPWMVSFASHWILSPLNRKRLPPWPTILSQRAEKGLDELHNFLFRLCCTWNLIITFWKVSLYLFTVIAYIKSKISAQKGPWGRGMWISYLWEHSWNDSRLKVCRLFFKGSRQWPAII